MQVQSYYHREIYTVCYLLAAAWPAFYGFDFVKANAILCGTWALGCAAMSVFTLLPAIKVEDPNLILLGGLLIFLLGVLYIIFEKSLLTASAPANDGFSASKPDGLSRVILGVQVGLIALAMFVTRSSVASLQAKQGLPLGTQVVGWVTLSKSFIFCQPSQYAISGCVISYRISNIALEPLLQLIPPQAPTRTPDTSRRLTNSDRIGTCTMITEPLIDPSPKLRATKSGKGLL